MNSPFANAYLAILNRIKTEVPEILFIEHDFGQLENYTDGKPAVAWPCALIDFDQWVFENMGNNAQRGEGDVIIKVGQSKWADTHNVQPDEWREAALSYYDIETKLNSKLHTWTPGDNFGALTRTQETKENRPLNVRVKIIRYRLTFEDYSATPEETLIPRPNVSIQPDDE